jgi:hypothetical protein
MDDPSSYKEAVRSENSNKWLEATEDELSMTPKGKFPMEAKR